MSRLYAVGGLLWLSVLGCGYRFTPRSAGLPGGVSSVCAPVFRNDTAEPGLETLFTRVFRQELVRVGALGGSGSCQASVEGVVVWVNSAPTIVTEPVYEGNTVVTGQQLASYRASAGVTLRLVRDGQVLAETTVSGNEDFLPGAEGASGDVLQAEANRQAALYRLAETLMREGYDRLANNW
ncbi:LPS assembly lipoprotein LptE [Cystobacter fuscus]|uniref:LPS assembly lipoprotein LptE n=1 Tax=Cystobacter fuscus TaxID=43 RepID=UPI002B31EB0F|nr:hypothetical protein F0U63_17130 [Cystobacter fuscus]